MGWGWGLGGLHKDLPAEFYVTQKKQASRQQKQNKPDRMLIFNPLEPAQTCSLANIIFCEIFFAPLSAFSFFLTVSAASVLISLGRMELCTAVSVLVQAQVDLALGAVDLPKSLAVAADLFSIQAGVHIHPSTHLELEPS